MEFIGIDPGAGGGIAVVNNAGRAEAWKMPATERDVYDLLAGIPDSYAVIEHVHSMPQQGVASSFKFGASYGFVRGCLIGCGIPFEQVGPRSWMKALGIRVRHKTETPTQWKNFLKSIAQQLFPEVRVTLKTADALLIAEYCRRTVSIRRTVA